MTVTLEARTPCLLCGYQHQVIQVSHVRINRHSMRTLGNGLISLGGHHCPECGTENAASGIVPISPMRLHPADEAKVRAYQVRKGWRT